MIPNNDLVLDNKESKVKLQPNDLDTLVDKIKLWSIERKLYNQNPQKQVIKLLEEFGELARALLKDDTKEIIDSLGDMLVVLIILHQQLDLELFETLFVAYNEIKDRKGKTINGVFIKESDL